MRETDGFELEPPPPRVRVGIFVEWAQHNTLGIARAVLPVHEYRIVYSRDAA